MFCVFFFFKQKTAYEMRISDWSSDVCSSDLQGVQLAEAEIWIADGVGGGHETEDIGPCPYPANASLRGPAMRGGPGLALREIGRASCRERVCQYVLISAVAVSLTKQKIITISYHNSKYIFLQKRFIKT